MDRVLFAPVQMLFSLQVQRCCGGVTCYGGDDRRGSSAPAGVHQKCVVNNWRTESDCCAVVEKPTSEMATRGRFSVDPTAAGAPAAPTESDGPIWLDVEQWGGSSEEEALLFFRPNATYRRGYSQRYWQRQ